MSELARTSISLALMPYWSLGGRDDVDKPALLAPRQLYGCLIYSLHCLYKYVTDPINNRGKIQQEVKHQYIIYICNIHIFKMIHYSVSPFARNPNRIWVRSQNCGCLITWFCYQLIAKPGNKTATVPWPDPYAVENIWNAMNTENQIFLFVITYFYRSDWFNIILSQDPVNYRGWLNQHQD